MEEEGHLEVHGRLRKQIAIKTNLAGTMDAKTLKLQFRVGGRDLPETSNRYTSGQTQEKGAQMCPCGKAKESRNHIVGAREKYKEERDVLEDMRQTDECHTEKFSTPPGR